GQLLEHRLQARRDNTVRAGLLAVDADAHGLGEVDDASGEPERDLLEARRADVELAPDLGAALLQLVADLQVRLQRGGPLGVAVAAEPVEAVIRLARRAELLAQAGGA